jgi:hypothetical protein
MMPLPLVIVSWCMIVGYVMLLVAISVSMWRRRDG